MDEAYWARLSQERAGDAQSFLAAGRWSAAYYLAGYAVECRLKACIVKRIRNDPGIVFNIRHFANQIWTHDIPILLEQADLSSKLQAEKSPLVAANWSLIRAWKETSRYTFWSDAQATNLINAISDPTNGVLAWIDRNA